jgi:hypothetical protein
VCAESSGLSVKAIGQFQPHPEVSVARQPSNRSDRESSQVDVGAARRPTPADRELWEDVRIDPVEIALPTGSGFTLRAYRMSTDITATDISQREDDDIFASRTAAAPAETDDETVVILEEGFTDEDLEVEETATQRGARHARERDDADAELAEDQEEAAEEATAEEVPVFLSHRGRVLLFRTPEGLVDFVRAGEPNDLAQIDTYQEMAKRIQPADVAPLEEDTYELDLVVENLRGGHDVWDGPLVIRAGELARDLSYALRMPAVMDMLAPGSSLDDLDEALRSTAGGGLGAFRGRRRLRRIGAQTASLGWRTIIGKISAAVDWRD